MLMKFLKNWERKNRADRVRKNYRFMTDPGPPSAEHIQFRSGFMWAYEQYREGHVSLMGLLSTSAHNPKALDFVQEFNVGVRTFVRAVEADLEDTQ